MFSLATSNGILDTGPWSFKFQQSAQDQFPLLGKHVLEKTPIRKMAIVYDRTNEGQMDQKNVFREAFKAGGGTVVMEESVGSNDTNFAPLVTKILSLDVDAVFLSLYAEQGGNLMVQMRQAGLPAKVRFIGNTAIASPRVLAIAGKAAEGTLVMSEYITGIPRNKSFEAAYKARYNIEPDSWAAGGYAMGQIGVRALKDAGPNPTPEKVRNAFMNIRDVPVPVGSGVWNHKDRKPSFGAVILVVADGKFVVAP
jgi:branched-chain amino acid transport system substrate-binding protein